VRARELGEASPAYALALANHGFLLWDRERYAEGEKEVRRAIAIETAIRPRPIETCVAIESLASRLMESGRGVESIELMKDALPCIQRAFAPQSIIALWSRLSVLGFDVLSGRGKNAVAPLQAVDRDIVAGLPKAPWLHAEALLLLGTEFCREKRPAEAGSVLGEALAIRSAWAGKESGGAREVRALMQSCGVAAP
jgi:hypothetical protein